jgi:hypothetical protein
MPRYTTIYSALQQNGKIDTKTAENTVEPQRIHMLPPKTVKLGTIWSVIATLKKLKIFRAEGHLCRAKYEPDGRLNKAVQTRQRK